MSIKFKYYLSFNENYSLKQTKKLRTRIFHSVIKMMHIYIRILLVDNFFICNI